MTIELILPNWESSTWWILGVAAYYLLTMPLVRWFCPRSLLDQACPEFSRVSIWLMSPLLLVVFAFVIVPYNILCVILSPATERKGKSAWYS